MGDDPRRGSFTTRSSAWPVRSLNRLDVARPMEIRDLESLGPLVASSLRSDATAQGPWLSKSRISTDSASNLYACSQCRLT